MALLDRPGFSLPLDLLALRLIPLVGKLNSSLSLLPLDADVTLELDEAKEVFKLDMVQPTRL